MRRTMAWLLLGMLLPGSAGAFASADRAGVRPGNRLEAPFQVEADGKKIDLVGGFSTPLVTDWDGDGKEDLLLGGGKDVRLWIYRNGGEVGTPVFDDCTHFKAAGELATVPDGFG